MSNDDSRKDEQLPEWVKIVNDCIKESEKRGRKK
jgi:hypothetical protein